MTLNEISEIELNSFITVYKKIGQLSNMPMFSITKRNSIDYKKMTENELFIVVTRQGLLDYPVGGALVASYEGKEDIHYKIFQDANSVFKFINN